MPKTVCRSPSIVRTVKYETRVGWECGPDVETRNACRTVIRKPLGKRILYSEKTG
jgi:hypothetical protein